MLQRMKTWILRFGPALVIMALIFLASNTPGSELPAFGAEDILVKKGGHMIGYALLAAAYYHALTNSKRSSRIFYLMAFCLTAMYAATDEWHQRFTPGRMPSIQDVCIDSTGGMIGLALWYLIQARVSKPTQSTQS
jgi:VanZ family protein